MEEWQRRVEEEAVALGRKAFDLSKFIGSEKFNELDKFEQVRLKLQMHYMAGYYNILVERIGNFK